MKTMLIRAATGMSAMLMAGSMAAVTGTCVAADGVAGRAVPALVAVNDAHASPAASYRTITWDILVPKGWNPMAALQSSDYSQFTDADPRAIAALKKLKEASEHAPVNPKLNDTRVRIGGYLVPLDFEKGKVNEFLLVPYFGACIHTPPPPPNQIIHVTSNAPLEGLHSMDPVWVSGTLRTSRWKSVFGTNVAYQIAADSTVLYTPPSK